MEEKYQLLNKREICLQIEGCPINVTSVELFKHVETEEVVGRVQFESVSDKTITAVVFDVSARSVLGDNIEGVEGIQYLDLHVNRGELFGEEYLVNFPVATTRGFEVEIQGIVFDDGDIWRPEHKKNLVSENSDTSINSCVMSDCDSGNRGEENTNSEEGERSTTLEVQNDGNELSAEINTNRKVKKGLKIIGILVAIFILIKWLFGGPNAEYTNNTGDKLPVVVNRISISESSFGEGYAEITYEIENRSGNEYREADFAVLAWDSNGFPIKLAGFFDLEPDYLKYIVCENIEKNACQEYTYTFETERISYLAVFLESYEDFNGNVWNNPIMDYIEESKGKKWEDVEVYSFRFDWDK